MKNKKFRAQKFPSLVNLSIFVSIFFESTRNGSIDGRKNAGAYNYHFIWLKIPGCGHVTQHFRGNLDFPKLEKLKKMF